VLLSRLFFERPLLFVAGLASAALAGIALFENLPYERQPPAPEALRLHPVITLE
jgi:hypothetical protein